MSIKKNGGMVEAELTKLRPMLAKADHLVVEGSKISLVEGLTSYYHSDYEMAIAKFSDALKKNEMNLDARYFRAKAYEKIGSTKKCLADLKDLKDQNYRDSRNLYNALQKK